MASAVHRGTAFEQRSLRMLQAHFSMALGRVGGRADGGIDLVGWWWLPLAAQSDQGALPDPDGLLRRRLRVLAQCKAEKKKFSPKYVREMEGVWHLHARSPPDVHPTVALLLSESPFSKATLLHAYQSTVPFLLIHLPSPSSSESSATPSETEMSTLCPNPTLTHLVKPLAFRWERTPFAATDGHMSGRPGLWWQGRKLSSWAPDSPDSDTT